MTEAEKNEIVGLVMTEISSQAVDFDITTEQPQASDLLTAVREVAGRYVGVTLKWDDVARIATELANQAATRAEQAKTNVENMKTSVEQTVTDFNALAEEKKQEVQGVYQSDLNELKGDFAEIHDVVLGGYSLPELIFGNLTIGTDGVPTYQTNRTYGVITPQGKDAFFIAGQVVGLSSYALSESVGVKFFVALNDGNGKYPTGSGWKQQSYTIPTTGYYCINIQTTPTTNLSSSNTLSDLFVVLDSASLKYRVSSAEDEINRIIEAVGDTTYRIPTLTLGDITIVSGVPTYKDRNYGVITPKGSYCNFSKGCVLSLSDYSDAKFAVGLLNGDGTVTDSGWVTSGSYTIMESGQYILNIQSKSLTAQSSTEALFTLFTVAISSIKDRLNALENADSVRENMLYAQTGIKVVKVINNYFRQGACVVGDTALNFHASNDEHTNHAMIELYNMTDLTNPIGYIEHNTGHCASADYAPDTDTLLIANGNYPAPTPTLYLIGGFASKLQNRDNIEYNGSETTALVLSSLFSTAVVGCFGETGDIVYVVTAPENYDTEITKTIYKLQIGYGTNNMVTAFPSASVGTYTYLNDDAPNGTAKIIDSYTVDFPGELQGLKYINGLLVIPMDSRVPTNIKTPYLVCVVLGKSKARVSKTFWIPVVAKNGSQVACEAEDVIFYGTDGYCTANQKIYKFCATQL